MDGLRSHHHRHRHQLNGGDTVAESIEYPKDPNLSNVIVEMVGVTVFENMLRDDNIVAPMDLTDRIIDAYKKGFHIAHLNAVPTGKDGRIIVYTVVFERS